MLIWNQLARGNAEFCAILVAINSILQVILYSPLAVFYLKVRRVCRHAACCTRKWTSCTCPCRTEGLLLRCAEGKLVAGTKTVR